MEKKHNEYKHRNNTNTPFKYKYANIEKELNQPFEYEKFLHDMKEHLFVLEALYGTADHDRAKDYHDKLMKKIVSFRKFSNDPILQALLSKICKDCEINNIEFVYSIKGESALSELSDFDKVTIFSNILNNAYEAALLCTPPNKYINFKILKLNHAIVIYVRNIYNTKLKKKNGEYISTKFNHKGIGTKNVMCTVDKLCGILNICTTDTIFEIVIYIPNHING